jgi:hypothetical protein
MFARPILMSSTDLVRRHHGVLAAASASSAARGKLIFFINRAKQFSAVWREDFG